MAIDQKFNPDAIARGRIFSNESLEGGLGEKVEAPIVREDATVLQRMAMLEKRVAVLHENNQRLAEMLSHIARTLGV